MKKTLKIGPSTFKIRKHKRGDRGWCRPYKSIISLIDNVPKDVKAEVLLHEALHAIFYTFNVWKHIKNREKEEDLEEIVVTDLSTALCTVFKQNPWLLVYLKKGLA